MLPAASWAARSRVPLLFHCHHRLRSGPVLSLIRSSLRIARAPALGCCDFVLEPFKSHATWTRVVYNGVTAVEAIPRRTSFRQIGVIGRICEQKGQHLLLEAARLMKGPARFVLFGAPESSQYFDRLKRLARELPVEFAGYQQHPARMIDVLVVPSAPDEATTRVIPEAWAARVPVVAFASGGIKEIVEHGVNGFLVERRTPDNLAHVLDALLAKPAVLQAAAEQGYKTWLERFTLERYQGQVLRAIERAAGTAPPR
jgi:glycosyltransferase involved in cell wall biosynthesis